MPQHFFKLTPPTSSFFRLIRLGPLTPTLQIIIIASLFILRMIQSLNQFHRTGSLWGYPVTPFFGLAPLYEEIIFRGLLLPGLSRHYSPQVSLVITSLLFSVWHLKNAFFLTPPALAYQMLYAGLVIGPLLAFLALKTRTIWPGVIIHYLNNIWSPYSWVLLRQLLG